MRRHLLALVMLLLGMFLPPAAPGRADDAQPDEYAVKAAFLYNFAKFTEWPERAFCPQNPALTLCVLGENPFGGRLDALRSKTVHSRPVALRLIADSDEAAGCHLLFISASEQQRIDGIVQGLGKQSLLTVSDMKGFLQAGGMIAFATVDSRIRFEINNRAAKRSGIKISSQLLTLARSVVD